MKIKENLNISTDDFFYDLFDGGALNPFEICQNKKDAKKIIEAINLIRDFQESCDAEIDGFYC